MDRGAASRAILTLLVAVSLAVCGCIPTRAAEGEGSSGSVWVIVFLAAAWVVILSAVLIAVFRIRRREKREEEEGVEFTSKEY